jgi:hypothetical protein
MVKKVIPSEENKQAELEEAKAKLMAKAKKDKKISPARNT